MPCVLIQASALEITGKEPLKALESNQELRTKLEAAAQKLRQERVLAIWDRKKLLDFGKIMVGDTAVFFLLSSQQ